MAGDACVSKNVYLFILPQGSVCAVTVKESTSTEWPEDSHVMTRPSPLMSRLALSVNPEISLKFLSSPDVIHSIAK